MLDSIDVEVDGAVEGGEEVADAGGVGHPCWPDHLSAKDEESKSSSQNPPLPLPVVKVPKCLEST